MGPTIESRYTPAVQNGADNMNSESHSANRNGWLFLTVILCALELILIIVLSVLYFGEEEKVCTYEDVMKELEKDSSPSENWKIYESFVFYNAENAMDIYADAYINHNLTNENKRELFSWATTYVEKFGGEMLEDNFIPKKVDAFLTIQSDAEYWRILIELDDKCARFDLTKDFSILDKYTLTAGTCNEYR